MRAEKVAATPSWLALCRWRPRRSARMRPFQRAGPHRDWWCDGIAIEVVAFVAVSQEPRRYKTFPEAAEEGYQVAMALQAKAIVPTLLTLSGIAAAFGLAACCALPLMLLSLGFGTAWLVGIGFYAGLHRPEFLAVAAAGLVGGAVTLMVNRRRIGVATRSVMSVGLLAGAVMLYYGYIYA